MLDYGLISSSVAKAQAEGIEVKSIADAAAWADIVMILTPDELQKDIYNTHIANNIREGAALMFAHGLSIHFNLIEPRADLMFSWLRQKVRVTRCVASICGVAVYHVWLLCNRMLQVQRVILPCRMPVGWVVVAQELLKPISEMSAKRIFW